MARSTFPKSKCTKHFMLGPLLEVEMSKKCTPLWREAHFEVKMLKAPHARTTFGSWDVVSRGRCKGLCTLSKVSKTWGFPSISKHDARRETFDEDLERCIFRGRCSTRDMFSSDLQVCWGDLRDRCSTSYDLASLFCGRRSNLDRLTGNIAKRFGTSALHSTFHFWRMSRKIASFLMLST